jgi:hypothetical protein
MRGLQDISQLAARTCAKPTALSECIHEPTAEGLTSVSLDSSPFVDSELIAAAETLITKLVKAGVLNFADMVNTMVGRFGNELALKLGPLMEQTWDHVREEYKPEGMSPSGKVSEILCNGGSASDDHPVQ